MRTRLAGLLRKELIQFSRDRVVLFLILYLYTIEVFMCTMALSFEVRQMPFAVVDHDRSVASRQLVDMLERSEAFADPQAARSAVEAGHWLATGEVGMVLVIPPGFEQRYNRSMRPSLQLLLDGTNSNVAESVGQYARRIVERFASERSPLAHATGDAARTEPVVRLWYNPAQTTANFMVLSMIGLAGMLVGVIYPAASIVREKEQGTIEQLLVTPVSLAEVLIAKSLPTLAINVLALFPALLTVVAFDVPVRGSLVTFVLMTAGFQLSAIAFGVFVASVTRTLQQALLLAFFALFPIMFLSGTLTPLESMPPLLQTVSFASPLRYFMEIILGVFLKGAGWAELWDESLALLAIGAAWFAVAAWTFRQRIA